MPEPKTNSVINTITLECYRQLFSMVIAYPPRTDDETWSKHNICFRYLFVGVPVAFAFEKFEFRTNLTYLHESQISRYKVTLKIRDQNVAMICCLWVAAHDSTHYCSVPEQHVPTVQIHRVLEKAIVRPPEPVGIKRRVSCRTRSPRTYAETGKIYVTQ